MKRYRLLLFLAGLALFIPGCGFDNTDDTTVMVIEATPTPVPTATPIPVATPTPEPTPTPAVVYEQTASGVNIEKKDGLYTTTSDVNLRVDCSTEVDYLTGIPAGTQLQSTGVSEDGAWIQVVYNGQTGYVSAQYTAPAEAAPAESGEAAAEGEAAVQ